MAAWIEWFCINSKPVAARTEVATELIEVYIQQALNEATNQKIATKLHLPVEIYCRFPGRNKYCPDTSQWR
jgi:hypothetical protein